MVFNIIPQKIFLCARTNYCARTIVKFVVNFWGIDDHLTQLVEMKVWVKLFPYQSAVFKFSDCANHSQTKEHILWVINEVGTIEERISDINDSNCHQLAINSVVEVVCAECFWVDSFILESVILVVNPFGVP